MGVRPRGLERRATVDARHRRIVGSRRIIDQDIAVSDEDAFARQSDDPLDVRPAAGTLEDNQLPALRRSPEKSTVSNGPLCLLCMRATVTWCAMP